VLVVDDHPAVRVSLAQLINDEPDMAVCAAAATPAEALDQVPKVHPDLAVVDLSLGESSGLDLIETLRVSYPALRILVLSMHDEELFAERALRAGAQGYLMKGDAARHLLSAVRRVARGGVYLSARVSERIRPALPSRSPLA
jgi:DNA-binding NarL/FixJ family response regulator